MDLGRIARDALVSNMIGLDSEQNERVSAARAAVEILRDAGLPEWGSPDLIDLAFWIHTGIDPSGQRLLQRQAWLRSPRNPFPDAAEWRADESDSGS